MKRIVFYSWQSDLPNSCNRGFIQDALENAAAAIRADDSVEVEPVIDRDTQGVPGAPDIAATIFSKIIAADVFVADISIIGRSGSRANPNPNVLIELGFAMKALGYKKVVPVFNLAFGRIEELPFDLRMRRIITYELPDGQPKGPERKVLEKHLDNAIRAAIESDHQAPASVPIPAVAAIENQQANRIIVLRRNLDAIFQKLDELQPKRHSEGGTVEELMEALTQTQGPVAEFSKIAETIAVINDTEAALAVHRWFGRVFERYNLPERVTGVSSNADQDYFKFVGHELFVTMVAFLLHERRWKLLGECLAEPIPLRYLRRAQGPGNVAWYYASDGLPSLFDASTHRGRVSVHADLLNERHTTGGLAGIMPMDEFMAADYFLFLRGEMSQEESDSWMTCRPWSALYLNRVPLFLRDADRRQVAAEIMKIFDVPNADEFRRRFAERAPRLKKLVGQLLWSSPVTSEDIANFGTR